VIASTSRPVCEPLGPARFGALAELFRRAGSACFCQYFHFEGGKNDWQARLAFEPERNEQALGERALLDPPRGIVAMDGGDCVGWMKLEPAEGLPKLYGQRLYRNLPCFAADREGVWTIGCFLVDPARRRQGVARALVRAGIDSARAHGASALEVFPRRVQGVGAEELWTGPFLLLESEGFEVVHDQAQYPVMRRSIA